jgi:hypothetical protein
MVSLLMAILALFLNDILQQYIATFISKQISSDNGPASSIIRQNKVRIHMLLTGLKNLVSNSGSVMIKIKRGGGSKTISVTGHGGL